jgi:heme-degrading monooxygenase HmoA
LGPGTPPKRVTIQAWDSHEKMNAWYNSAEMSRLERATYSGLILAARITLFAGSGAMSPSNGSVR